MSENNNNNKYNIRTKEIVNLIKEIEEQEKDESFEFDLQTFVSSFDVIKFALGTIIGFASTRIIEDLTKNNIMPIVDKVVFNDYIEDVRIFGYDLNLQSLISNIIYFLIVLAIVYLVVRFLIIGLVRKTIKDQQKLHLERQKLNLYNVLINKKILNNLEEIKNISRQRDTAMVGGLPEDNNNNNVNNDIFPQEMNYNNGPEPFDNNFNF